MSRAASGSAPARRFPSCGCTTELSVRPGAMPMIGIVVLAVWVVTSSVLCMQKHAVAHALPHAALSH